MMCSVLGMVFPVFSLIATSPGWLRIIFCDYFNFFRFFHILYIWKRILNDVAGMNVVHLEMKNKPPNQILSLLDNTSTVLTEKEGWCKPAKQLASVSNRWQ